MRAANGEVEALKPRMKPCKRKRCRLKNQGQEAMLDADIMVEASKGAACLCPCPPRTATSRKGSKKPATTSKSLVIMRTVRSGDVVKHTEKW